MTGTLVELGCVTAPSGVLVFGMAGWIDYWPQTGRGLFERAVSAVADGGGHLRDGLCEAVAVPAAADRLLTVRASTSPSPFDGEPTIAVLEVELGVPWPAGPGDQTRLLGDLPVDRCGMVLGDGKALDGFVGLGGASTDGLADLAYWGRHADAAQAVFGGERLGSPGGARGWLDLPVADAEAKARELEAWVQEHEQGRAGVLWSRAMNTRTTTYSSVPAGRIPSSSALPTSPALAPWASSGTRATIRCVTAASASSARCTPSR